MYYHTKQILKDKDKTVTEYKVIDKDKLTIDLDLEANHDYTLEVYTKKSGLLATKRAISSVENIGFIISPLFYYSQLLFF
ncbi:MAG: hypothetical protein QM222_09180 [Bacillota bacterium]|nr:hypothetical protein [Bacillota bacterium]